MESHSVQTDSTAWLVFVKVSWVAAIAAVGVGTIYLPVDLWAKGYMAMGILFAMGTSFTLAKTLRDQHEAQRLINRITEAKTEKILQEYSDV
ncbi:MAG: hypothetical protein ETSY1_27235 [Candidatus Entotheonella factor]|uniref:YiaAB two helix domain-containing protein n=1 Tax=Entotheonella factor TaxID=1429438 RepID=W4LDZ8_ENTF1|nr:YiaA/YiaB family inner membrane protein [Candidatus Entotheonella palauensis]ETW96288.1 MAG: hypothetical protein ETSY1_27235 [Candidatus Entotheonella factor]